MDLKVERRGHVVWARLNRPASMNALSSSLCEDLDRLAAEIEQDVSMRCLVLTGTGRAFCAGADLKERGKMEATDRWRYVRRLNQVVARLDALPVPVIAAINGFAMGGGVELAAVSDFRLAARAAVFGLPEVRWGIIAGGSIVRLVRDVSPAAAARLCFTGDRIDAETAQRLGIVDAVYDSVESLEENAHELSERIARNAPLALRASKRLMRGATAAYTATAMNLMMEVRVPLENTNDSVEGLRAFAEKREPSFTGS